MSIKLEVGKTYVTKQGAVVDIIKMDYSEHMPYHGSNGMWYTLEGAAYRDSESSYDLIEEANPETKEEEEANPETKEEEDHIQQAYELGRKMGRLELEMELLKGGK